MAHVIIFTDRAPRAWSFDNVGFNQCFYSVAAGAYKLASVIRQHGLDALVVPNCLSLSLTAIREIITNNNQNLLWIGISTTFLSVKSNGFGIYRERWHNSQNYKIGVKDLVLSDQGTEMITEMAWSSREINAVADCADVPLLVGGAWVSHINQGNLVGLKKNVFVITGSAEKLVEDFTLARFMDNTVLPEVVNSNQSYDQTEFKNSNILWDHTDYIDSTSWLPVEVARGCAFNCAYCTYDHKNTKDSFKNPSVLKDELIRNFEYYGVTNYMILDDLYNDSQYKVRLLYDKVWSQLPFKPQWSGYLRLDMIYADPDSAEILLQSGARMGSFGIETLNDRAGRRVGKGLGRTRTLETLSMLKEIWDDQVLVEGLFIAGLPYESLDSIIDTMEWSVTTDLLFSYSWNPLWITPPSHFSITTEKDRNDISVNNEKFAIKWPEPTVWQNSMGVRFDQVERLCVDIMQRLPMGMRIGFADYADLRAGGLTHEDIIGIKQGDTSETQLVQVVDTIQQKINRRLDHALSISI